MKKNIGKILLCTAAAAILMNGCGKLDQVEKTTVYVDPDNGRVQEAIVDPYTEEDAYSEKELKTFVEEDAAAWNQEAGEDLVDVSGVKVSKDQVRIHLGYPDSEAYAGYHRTDFFAGTLVQAVEKGYDFSGVFLDEEGKEISASDLISAHPEYRVIIFEEAIQILTDQPIRYVSSNVKITSETTAEVTSDTANDEVGVVSAEKAYVIYE